MNAKVAVLCLLFAVSIGTAGAIVANRNHAPVSQGFTVYERESFYLASQSTPIASDESVRYQKADGSWRKEYVCNGQNKVAFSQPGHGVFSVDDRNRKLLYVGAPKSTVLTEEMLRSEPGFVSEQMILGYKTFLIHSDSVESGESDDFYICPALQGYALKRIERNKNGTMNVHEVTRVILGEPPENLFNSLPSYPVEPLKKAANPKP